MGYNSWGHKESDTTEGLTLSVFIPLFYNLECDTHQPPRDFF